MERHIHTFVQKDLNITPLSPLNRRFNPTKKDIRIHMALAADELRETKEAIAECLRIIKEWNIDLWKPRYFMTDYDEREINAIEETFPGILFFTYNIQGIIFFFKIHVHLNVI
ncbi:hypothetical protein FSP39_015447 [Pinctada imbricata]|uniref:Uncharacterized protein n=1 Tax=Pinctada imbricata TaxID=66713 RepID=A0AA88YKP3_PINIB|nr:hypothetical protein FSP39_015447 [Pinctada imbricata]